MRAIEARTFSGYGGLRQTELPRLRSVHAPAFKSMSKLFVLCAVTPVGSAMLRGRQSVP
jgi:hypothetical protein